MADICMTQFDLDDGDVAVFLFEPEFFGPNNMIPVYFHIDHDNRRNYYTVAKLDNEFSTVGEAKAFAKVYFSLTTNGDSK